MAAQKKSNPVGTGCGCLVGVVVLIIIIGAIAGGSSKSGSSSSNSSASSTGSGAEKEAQEYISQKSHTINLGRVDYEHIELLIGLAAKSGGEAGTVVDEIAKVAQESHDEIDGFRQELFKSGGDEKLGEATLLLSEGANELKNAMGAIVAYTANPNPATLAHVTIQLETAKGKWNQGVDEIWEIAHEHGAMRLK